MTKKTTVRWKDGSPLRAALEETMVVFGFEFGDRLTVCCQEFASRFEDALLSRDATSPYFRKTNQDRKNSLSGAFRRYVQGVPSPGRKTPVPRPSLKPEPGFESGTRDSEEFTFLHGAVKAKTITAARALQLLNS